MEMNKKRVKIEGQIVLNFTIIEEVEYNEIKQTRLITPYLANNEDYKGILKLADTIGVEGITFDKSDIKEG
jgi:hypothetical protein